MQPVTSLTSASKLYRKRSYNTLQNITVGPSETNDQIMLPKYKLLPEKQNYQQKKDLYHKTGK
jgi:hypothetical protein